MRKNLKMWIFLGASAVVVAAAIVSTYGKKTPAILLRRSMKPRSRRIQDNTDNNVQDLKNQLAAERQKEAQAAAAQAPSDERSHRCWRHTCAAGNCRGLQVRLGKLNIVHTGPTVPATRSLCATTNFPATRTGAATGGQGAGTGI